MFILGLAKLVQTLARPENTVGAALEHRRSLVAHIALMLTGTRVHFVEASKQGGTSGEAVLRGCQTAASFTARA